MKKFTLFILFTFITFSFIVGQNLVATGISNQSQIRNIITNAGFTIQDEQLSNINSSTLAEKQVLALFNGSQTWNGTQLFTTSQANDIVNFVQNGGYLYISSRKGYDNLLSQFGVTTNGNDGGSSGFDWPLIELSATQFPSYPITQSLSSIVGDVGASFTVDENWTIIGEDNSGTDLLAIRNYENGKIVLWYGQRSYRDPGSSGNVYETDITEGSNTQYHINLFNYFASPSGTATLLATGILNQTQIRTIIADAGYTIQDEQLSNVNSSTLAGKEVLALFNGSQTWNGTQLFTTSQANDIVNFVQNGGYLYISSRKGYDNLLSQFGVTTNGNDGGSSGFDWPLIELSATQFSSHPITQDLTSVVGDVGANFTTDENWTIIGEDNSGTDLLAVRNYGIGKVVLWYGQRSYRDPGASGNVYETDITEGSNTQYHINLFTYFSDLTDISTIKYSLETNIYPNPANQSFSVTGNNITSVEIFNFQGQYISFYKVSTLPLTINISNLKNGIYIVRISSDRFSSIKKLIKQ